LLRALDGLEASIHQRLEGLSSSHDVAALRAETLGKKGALGAALRGLKDVDAAERPAVGQQINQVKQRLEALFDAAAAKMEEAGHAVAQAAARYDATLPGRRLLRGAAHPLRLIEQEIFACLVPLGFEVVEGPLIEHEWFNFEALNMPADHPARDMHDTFFVRPDVVLRTHTSSVQIRTMMQRQPPVRILAPGMVFRRDEVDATHSPAFHQVEGLWVDEHATFADLKGVLRTLTMHLFGPQTQVRFRPSFFPFTEPSCEVDVSCVACGGATGAAGAPCKVCRGSGWLEVLGAGMVHPAVLQSVGYDPDKVQGFAFGLGLDRLAMLRWGIDDIRVLYDNDVRFLQHTAGVRP
jgi:phenylalanyl-tRNA synthetase alpha chain